MTQNRRLTGTVSERDHAQGPARAPLTLVQYGDYECPYTRQSTWVVQAIQQQLGDRLRFIFRNFPLVEIHPHALHAALAAEAAAAQGKFWQMHDYLFHHQHTLEDADLTRFKPLSCSVAPQTPFTDPGRLGDANRTDLYH